MGYWQENMYLHTGVKYGLFHCRDKERLHGLSPLILQSCPLFILRPPVGEIFWECERQFSPLDLAKSSSRNQRCLFISDFNRAVDVVQLSAQSAVRN